MSLWIIIIIEVHFTNVKFQFFSNQHFTSVKGRSFYCHHNFANKCYFLSPRTWSNDQVPIGDTFFRAEFCSTERTRLSKQISSIFYSVQDWFFYSRTTSGSRLFAQTVQKTVPPLGLFRLNLLRARAAVKERERETAFECVCDSENTWKEMCVGESLGVWECEKNHYCIVETQTQTVC